MRFPKLNGGLFGGNFLRVTFFAGLILFIVTGTMYMFVFFSGRSETVRQEENFYRILRDYDRAAMAAALTNRDFEKLNGELDRLEKKAIGVESWLSVLKRRRSLADSLARTHPPSAEAYRQSLRRAAEAYPWSQPIAALAAAALVKDTALNREAEAELRDFLPLLSDPSFNTLRLNLHILLGDFSNPERAVLLPRDLVSDGTETISTDMVIIKTLRGDTRAAAAEIQSVLNTDTPASDEFIRFAAEYYYDFGDLIRSAELFSRIENEAARQADALWLAGASDSARFIWSILAEIPDERSLYNLAVISENGEELIYLEELTAINEDSVSDSRQFGLIRYSRLLPYPQALALLENSALQPSDYPFIDLEIRRRKAQVWETGRQLAETWLLLDRHPENEDMYQWAAWFIFYQRYYNEAEVLFRRVDRYNMTGSWVPVFKAILAMQEGDLDAAASGFRAIPAETAEWPVYANMGRILESERSSTRALEQYELAAAKVQNPKAASRIQLCIARCHTALGRPNEARRALGYALDFDPDNLSARLELDRIFP
jgi:tetratricopeptide (TPR) repeat protein